MRSLIFCEGESDQVLLGYYICGKFGYQFERDRDIKGFNRKDKVCQYRNGNQDVVDIWAVGEKDRLAESIRAKLTDNKANTEREAFFDRYVVITDRDSDRELRNLLDELQNVLVPFTGPVSLKENQWVDLRQRIDFEGEARFQFCLTAIPEHGVGSIETFILESVGNQGENEKTIAEASQALVTGLKNSLVQPCEYLKTRRDEVKAPLGVYLSVVSPEKIFDKIDKPLRNLLWHQFPTIHSGLESLDYLKSNETDGVDAALTAN